MVDYKAQYLKYKFKYLQAKDLSKNKLKNNNFKGGSGEEILAPILGISAILAGLAYYKYVGNKNSYDDLDNELNQVEEEHSENEEEEKKEDEEKEDKNIFYKYYNLLKRKEHKEAKDIPIPNIESKFIKLAFR